MGKLKELNNTTKLVKQILMQDKKARNSDVYLYIKVCEKLNPEALHKPFIEVQTHLKEYGLPPIESVGRCRRKLRRAYPELAGNSDVEAQRTLNEEDFRTYARKVMV